VLESTSSRSPLHRRRGWPRLQRPLLVLGACCSLSLLAGAFLPRAWANRWSSRVFGLALRFLTPTHSTKEHRKPTSGSVVVAIWVKNKSARTRTRHTYFWALIGGAAARSGAGAARDFAHARAVRSRCTCLGPHRAGARCTGAVRLAAAPAPAACAWYRWQLADPRRGWFVGKVHPLASALDGDGEANYKTSYSRRTACERSIDGLFPTSLLTHEHGTRWVLVVTRGYYA
jgi:hypothetical protein